MELIRVLDRVPGFMPHDPHALGTRCAFDVEHLIALEPSQPRVGEVERHGEARHAAGREPLIRQPHVRLEHDRAGVELLVELRDAPLEPRAFDRHPEILESDLEQTFFAETLPRESRGHGVGKRDDRSLTLRTSRESEPGTRGIQYAAMSKLTTSDHRLRLAPWAARRRYFHSRVNHHLIRARGPSTPRPRRPPRSAA